MHIEIWSDVVCPWCFIGKRRLERALAAAGITDAVITHRAFQLDPSATTEGRRTIDVLAAKYGLDEAGVKQMMGQRSLSRANLGQVRVIPVGHDGTGIVMPPPLANLANQFRKQTTCKLRCSSR